MGLGDGAHAAVRARSRCRSSPCGCTPAAGGAGHDASAVRRRSRGNRGGNGCRRSAGVSVHVGTSPQAGRVGAAVADRSRNDIEDQRGGVKVDRPAVPGPRAEVLLQVGPARAAAGSGDRRASSRASPGAASGRGAPAMPARAPGGPGTGRSGRAVRSSRSAARPRRCRCRPVSARAGDPVGQVCQESPGFGVERQPVQFDQPDRVAHRSARQGPRARRVVRAGRPRPAPERRASRSAPSGAQPQRRGSATGSSAAGARAGG